LSGAVVTFVPSNIYPNAKNPSLSVGIHMFYSILGLV
jgi:hypothetical protein